MKQRQTRLLALLSILIFLMVPCSVTAGGSGQLEVGATYSNIVDNTARVNEYVKNGAFDNLDDGFAASIKLDLEAIDGNSAFGMSTDIVDGKTFNLETNFDIARIFKLNISLDSLQHWKDHESLDQMGATARDDTGGSQPNVTTDKIYADLAEAGLSTVVGGASLVGYDPADAYRQEISNDYIITRREIKNEAELTIPSLPNVTFHAGMRIETRKGMEQAISLSKCAGCHVSATGKNIDERTEDLTFGATGKFGQLTMEYEYLTREFTEDADPATRYYIYNSNDQLLYPDAAGVETEFGKTPDSEKDSHLLKARYDFSQKTSLTASYVQADIESTKTDEVGVFEFENDNTLKSEYEGYNSKFATKLGPVKLSLRGGYYEIDGPEYSIRFDDRGDQTTTNQTFDVVQEYTSAESREVTEFGIDGVYHLTTGSTLRLGYNYENIEREEIELGETETHTLTAALKTRVNKTLSGRLSYKYQDIDDAFAGDHATGIAQGYPGSIYDPVSGLAYLTRTDFLNILANAGEPLIDGNTATNVYYWNSVYPSRGFEATNQPESVHEAKFSTTWAPSANMAATLYARVRYEDNDTVKYEQTTFVPGFSLWYAPNNKLNLTMAYNFSNQDTENRACVGWYHG